MAGNTRRPPSLDLVSKQVDEKTFPPTAGNSWQYPSPAPQWSPYSDPDTARPSPPPRSQFIRQPTSIPIRSISHSSCSSVQIFRTLKPWLPLIFYAISSLGFLTAIAFYRTELFACMSPVTNSNSSNLSLPHRPRRTFSMVTFGRELWSCSSFLSDLCHHNSYVHLSSLESWHLLTPTIIAPLPLYSTLIILSGYTFGPWTGAIISYFAALIGAIVVFTVSRALIRESIEHWLASCTSIKRVIRAIDKRPKLLFLIRLAPYPYNVMNCLLAASPTLTLHTYTVCTALSLFKVIIHTSLGASIHSFRDYHAQPDSSIEKGTTSGIMARVWTIVGIILCVLILIYLSIIARRAVDDELKNVPVTSRDPDSDESRAFLSPDSDPESALPPSDSGPMTEVPFRAQQLIPLSSVPVDRNRS